MNSLVGRRAAVGAALLLIAAGAACSKSAEGRPENGAPGGGRGGPGGPGVVLGPTDLAPVSRGTIERTIPVTGDLRPIETVDVKARLEGDLEQSEELFKQGALPERDVRAARQQVSAARARLVAAQSRLTSTSSFERDTRVLAPTTGTIATRVVEDGEHVARGATMFTLVRTDVLELAAALPARSANGGTPGQVVRFTADGASFEGRVARVSPTVDPVSRSITVYVQVPNPGSRLKGGTFASGRIVGGTRQGALLVPTAALRQGEGGQPYVFTVAADKIDQKPVQLGFVDEGRGMAEVLSGLAEGDRVVVGQVGTLGRGMSVTIVGGGEARASRGGPPAAR